MSNMFVCVMTTIVCYKTNDYIHTEKKVGKNV